MHYFSRCGKGFKPQNLEIVDAWQRGILAHHVPLMTEMPEIRPISLQSVTLASTVTVLRTCTSHPGRERNVLNLADLGVLHREPF